MNINRVQTTDTSTIMAKNPSLVRGISPAEAINTNASSMAKGIGPAESLDNTNNIKTLQNAEKSNQSAKEALNKDGAMSPKEAKEITEALNEYMDDLQTHIGFSIREDLGQKVVVEIKNRKTNELIKQIPSEELLKIMESMKELRGIIFDQSV